MSSRRCTASPRHSFTIICMVLLALSLLGSGCTTLTPAPSQTYHPELEFLKEHIFLKLKEKNQDFNSFKFIIYSEIIYHVTSQLPLQQLE